MELVDVHWLQGAPPAFKKGSLAKDVGGRKFPTPLPPPPPPETSNPPPPL